MSLSLRKKDITMYANIPKVLKNFTEVMLSRILADFWRLILVKIQLMSGLAELFSADLWR